MIYKYMIQYGQFISGFFQFGEVQNFQLFILWVWVLLQFKLIVEGIQDFLRFVGFQFIVEFKRIWVLLLVKEYSSYCGCKRIDELLNKINEFMNRENEFLSSMINLLRRY